MLTINQTNNKIDSNSFIDILKGCFLFVVFTICFGLFVGSAKADTLPSDYSPFYTPIDYSSYFRDFTYDYPRIVSSNRSSVPSSFNDFNTTVSTLNLQFASVIGYNSVLSDLRSNYGNRSFDTVFNSNFELYSNRYFNSWIMTYGLHSKDFKYLSLFIDNGGYPYSLDFSQFHNPLTYVFYLPSGTSFCFDCLNGLVTDIQVRHLNGALWDKTLYSDVSESFYFTSSETALYCFDLDFSNSSFNLSSSVALFNLYLTNDDIIIEPDSPVAPEFEDNLPDDIFAGGDIENKYEPFHVDSSTYFSVSQITVDSLIHSYEGDYSVLALYPINSYTFKGPTPESSQKFLERLNSWMIQNLQVSGFGFNSLSTFLGDVLKIENGSDPANNCTFNYYFSRSLYNPYDATDFDVVYFNPLTDNISSILSQYSNFYDIVFWPTIGFSGSYTSTVSGTFDIPQETAYYSSVFVSDRFYYKLLIKNLNSGFSNFSESLELLLNNSDLTYSLIKAEYKALISEFPYLNSLIYSDSSDDTIFGKLNTIIDKLENITPVPFDDSDILASINGLDFSIDNEIDTPFEVGFDVFDFSPGVLDIFGTKGGNDDLIDYFTNFFGLGDTGLFSFFDEAISFFDFFDTTPDSSQSGLFGIFFE